MVALTKMRQGAYTTATLAAILPTCLSLALDPNQNSGPRFSPARRQSDEICNPPISPAGEPIPPCAHIEYIETMCWPKGSDPVHYDGHAQCMCNGSFFAEWSGCQQCLFVHGLRSEQEKAFYAGVMASASQELCGAETPTAPFRSLFAQAEVTAERVTTGATVKSDLYPGNSDVGLYYTASGSQGLGKVTGAAATVTMGSGLATAGPFTTPKAEPTGAGAGEEANGSEGVQQSGGRGAAGQRTGFASVLAVALGAVVAANVL